MSIALIVNSHSSSEDVWEPFFGELKRFAWDRLFDRIYLLTSKESKALVEIKEKWGVHLNYLIYPQELSYNLQYLFCLKKIKEETVLIANEDCIPSGVPRKNEFNYIHNLIRDDNNKWDFVKLVRGPEKIRATNHKYLFEIESDSDTLFTQQVSIWNRARLLDIYSMSIDSEIARKGGLQQEVLGSQICRDMGFQGLLFYDNEEKRGMYHYDSSITPHICTAIVGGKWNISEYKKELDEIFIKYGINPNARGVYL
ncbi:hypothetical protein [Prochlorococcus sp. MIT 1300]|uniref:hypothetical protein n=1 Tax=Prochlorococcus sp. MIT 1300 TaxID=3096218 RepID=UPI002A7590ED|nr:hypothetical protein [Prochlorococcus sp. MIT 1300]